MVIITGTGHKWEELTSLSVHSIIYPILSSLNCAFLNVLKICHCESVSVSVCVCGGGVCVYVSCGWNVENLLKQGCVMAFVLAYVMLHPDMSS